MAIHSNPDEIPMGKSEGDPELRGRLKAFREKVAKNRLVKYWNSADELPEQAAQIPDIAPLDQKFEVFGSNTYSTQTRRKWNYEASWREIFSLIAPYLLEYPNEAKVKGLLASALFAKGNWGGQSPLVDDQVFQTIKVQLMALGLVRIQYNSTTKGGMALVWSITASGNSLMMSVRTIKSNR